MQWGSANCFTPFLGLPSPSSPHAASRKKRPTTQHDHPERRASRDPKGRNGFCVLSLVTVCKSRPCPVLFPCSPIASPQFCSRKNPPTPWNLVQVVQLTNVLALFLSAYSANEATLKRTLAPSDVFAALTELEFDSFRPRLERELEAHTEAVAGKKRATKEKKAAATAKPAETDADAVTKVAEVAGVDDDDETTTTRDVKRVKRDGDGNNDVPTTRMKEADETEDEEPDEDETEEAEEEEEDEEEEDEDEDQEDDDDDEEEDDGEGHDTAAADNDNVDRVEDLDADSSRRNPGLDDDDDDDDDSDDYDDDGPAAQLRQNLGLG
jgi:DNA polymerase epsilon subunit 3